MIARIWHGVTPGSKGNAYAEYLRKSGIKAYQSTDGCRGIYVLRRDLEDKSDFVLISLWDSYTAIERLALRRPPNATNRHQEDRPQSGEAHGHHEGSEIVAFSSREPARTVIPSPMMLDAILAPSSMRH